MSSIGRGKIRSTDVATNLRTLGFGITQMSLPCLRLFVSGLQKVRRNIEKKIDEKIQKDIQKQQQILQQMQSDLKHSWEQLSNELSKNITEIEAKVGESKTKIRKIEAEQERIEDDFLDKFDSIDEQMEREYNKSMKALSIEYDQQINNYKRSLEEYNTLRNQMEAMKTIIANKIQTLENYPDDEIQAEIDKIKRTQTRQSPVETYKQIIELENNLIIKARKSNFDMAIKKKLELEETLNITQFYSEDVKNRFLNDTREVSRYIAQQEYEKAIQKSNEIAEKLNQLRAFRDSNTFLEMETDFITLNDNIQGGSFVDQTIKRHLENMKRALDGENSHNFRELYRKTVDKLAYNRGTLIADAIRETLKEQGYEEIQINIEEHGRFKVRGFKDNKPLTFWIGPEGDFDFDFPEDALEDDRKCHQEIKTVLKHLKIRLKERGLQLNVIEITRKFRFKKAVKQVVEDITEQAVEETRSENGTVTIRTIDKERKLSKTRKRRKQIE